MVLIGEVLQRPAARGSGTAVVFFTRQRCIRRDLLLAMAWDLSWVGAVNSCHAISFSK